MTDIVRQMKINVTCTSIKSLQHICSDCDVEITRLPNLQHLFTLYVATCAHNVVIDGPVLTKLQLKELKLAMDPSSRTRECMAAVSAYLKKSMDETRSDYFSVCVSVCLCLLASISPKLHFRHSPNVCACYLRVARSFSGGTAIRHVLPVLWMML